MLKCGAEIVPPSRLEPTTMLISCFQCRQPLDVPEDSAGKRVRCAHCQFVIVVPTKPKVHEAPDGSVSAGPAMALPNLDLDAETERTVDSRSPAAKVPAASLPAPSPAPTEDLPPLPPIERGSRRRP